MLKTILRTSLLLAPLLTGEILQASNPVDEGPINEEPIKKLSLFSKQPDILAISKEEWEVAKPEQNDAFRGFSRDLMRAMMNRLDPEDQRALSQTSRYWRYIAAQVNNININNWIGERDAKLLPRMNPRALFALADRMAKNIPLRRVDYSPIDQEQIPQPILTATPADVQAFVDQVAANRQLSVMLARRTLGMDPGIHFREVLLMAAIVGKNALLSDYLSNVHWEYFIAQLVKASEGKYEKMSESEQDEYRQDHPLTFGDDEEYVYEFLHNGQELRRTLMALKLMALNPVPDDDLHQAESLLKNFADNHYYYSMSYYIDGVLAVEPNQPFWVCYTDSFKALSDYTAMVERINQKNEGGPSLVGVERITDYVDALFPGNLEIDLVKLHCGRQGLGFVHGDLVQAVQCEVEMMKRFNPDNLINYFDVLHSVSALEKSVLALNKDPVVCDNYNKMMELTDAMTKKPEAEGGPTKLQAAALMRLQAQSIIMFRDQPRFARLDDLMSRMDQVFANIGDDQVDVELNYKSLKYSMPFARDRHHMMMFASALIQGKWEIACQLVKPVKEFNGTLLVAVKFTMNDPAFPAALVKPIGNIISRTWKNIHKEGLESEGQKNFYRSIFDEAFMEKFLAGNMKTLHIGHPIVRSWINKEISVKSN